MKIHFRICKDEIALDRAECNLRKRADGPTIKLGDVEHLPIYNIGNAELLHRYTVGVRLPADHTDRRRALIHMAPIVASLWDATLTPLENDDNE